MRTASGTCWLAPIMFNDRDGDGASFWFDGEVFSNPSFDAKVYVDDLRRYVSVYTLYFFQLLKGDTVVPRRRMDEWIVYRN